MAGSGQSGENLRHRPAGGYDMRYLDTPPSRPPAAVTTGPYVTRGPTVTAVKLEGPRPRRPNERPRRGGRGRHARTTRRRPARRASKAGGGRRTVDDGAGRCRRALAPCAAQQRYDATAATADGCTVFLHPRSQPLPLRLAGIVLNIHVHWGAMWRVRRRAAGARCSPRCTRLLSRRD